MAAAKQMRKEESRLGEGVYTIGDIANILKIGRRRANYLVKEYLSRKFRDQQKFVYRLEENGNYTINFYSLIEIYVFHMLRKHGVSAQKIVKLHANLAQHLKTPYPFAKTELLVSGNEVYFEKSKNWISNGKLQYAIKDIIEHFGAKIKFSEDNLARQYYPLGTDKNILVDPEYRFGQPIIKNTNLLVENIYDTYIAEDKDTTYVSSLYNITEEQMGDVIEFMQAA